MRYFISNDDDETNRIRGGRREDITSGRRVYADPQTGERWTDFLFGMAPRGPFWSGLVRYPLPDADVLLNICAESDDLDQVAAASLLLDESVDTRWRLLDLVESIIGQSPSSQRVKVLLDYGVFEFLSGHCSSVGMTIHEIGRQYELSKRCAERSVAIRKRLPAHPRTYENPPSKAP